MRGSLLILLTLVIVLMATPWFAVYLRNASAVALEPARFLEEYSKFLGTIGTVIVSFLLIHVLWSRAENERQARRLVSVFVSHLKDLRDLLDRLLEGTRPRLLDAGPRPGEDLRSAERNFRRDIEQLSATASALRSLHSSSFLLAMESASSAFREWGSVVEPMITAAASIDPPRLESADETYREAVAGARESVSGIILQLAAGGNR